MRDDEYLFWFDPETGRMEQFAYSFHVGQGGVRFRKAYNWHEVGGILFSDQENWAVNGQGIPVEIVGVRPQQDGAAVEGGDQRRRGRAAHLEGARLWRRAVMRPETSILLPFCAVVFVSSEF